MSLTADALVDRQRSRRRVALWRAAAFVLAAVALVAVAAALGLLDRLGGIDRPHIARLSITGVITDDRNRHGADRRPRRGRCGLKAILLSVDSPGGTTAAARRSTRRCARPPARSRWWRRSAGWRPRPATWPPLPPTTSGAPHGDHRVDRRLVPVSQRGPADGQDRRQRQHGEVGAAEGGALAVHPRGGAGSREVLVRLVDDTYQWFVDIVAERRKLDRAEALRLADGAVYSGRQALALNAR